MLVCCLRLASLTYPMAGLCLLFLLDIVAVVAQSDSAPSSYPHIYDGEPKGDLGPEWQDCACFEMSTNTSFLKLDVQISV